MSNLLRSVLDGINSIVMNHGWSIVIFTVLIRLALMPLDIKSRKSMRKMSLINPEMQKLQKKYANDKQKLNMKMAELYKREKISPMSGCIPMLIQWPILIWMFSAMRTIANENMVAQVFRFLAEDAAPILSSESWLWVKNVWTPDSIFTSCVPDLRSLNMVGAEVWQAVYNTFSAEQLSVIAGNVQGVIDFSTSEATSASISAIMASLQNMPAYQQMASTVPGWSNIRVLLFNISLYQNYNGWTLLPILAGLSQVIQSKLMPQQNQQSAQNNNNNQNSQSTAKFMQVFFPILSVYFCLTSNAGFAIYWVTSNIVMGVSSVLINKYLEKQDKKNAASVTGEGSVK